MIDIFDEIHELIGYDQGNLHLEVNRGNYRMYSTTCEPEYMIRVFRNNPAKQVQEKFIAEAHMLDMMFEYHHIPSPELVAASLTDPKYLILIMEKLEGIPLHEAWSYLSSEKRLDLAREVGRMVRSLHKIDQPGYGIPNDYGEDWYYFLDDRIDISLHLLDPYLPEWLIEKTLQKSKIWLSQLDDEKGVITHGDLNPHNILIQSVGDRPEISGIIDWEWSIAAPAKYDLANLESLFYNSDPILDAFYKGYGDKPDEETWEYQRKLYLLDRFLQNARYYIVTDRYSKQHQQLTKFMLRSILK